MGRGSDASRSKGDALSLRKSEGFGDGVVFRSCNTLKRQDKECFGGLREAVLERAGYRYQLDNLVRSAPYSIEIALTSADTGTSLITFA